MKKDYPSAISAYREALDLYSAVSAKTEDVANALNDIASAEKGSGDLAAAERDYREELSMALSFNYTEGVATFMGNLASLMLVQKDWPGAETLARAALSLSEELDRHELVASDCQRLATALVRQRKNAEALPFALRAVDIFTKLGLPDLKDALETLAEC